MQNNVIFFFEKNLFPKTWKPLITKWITWIGLLNLPKEALENCNYPEHVLRLQKERQIWQKSKINLHFLWKTRLEATKFITNSLKTLDLVTPIPFDTFPWQNNVIFNLLLTRSGNKQTIKGTKLRSWNVFFFILENICFQSHESHYLSSNIRTSAHLLLQEKPIKRGHCTGN